VGFTEALLSAGVIVLAAVAASAAYLGAFRRVRVVERDIGPFRLLYREMPGSDFRQVGCITSELDRLLQAVGAGARRPFDVFYPPAHGHSNEIGFALADTSDATLRRILDIDASVQVKDIPHQRALVVEFPWRSRLSFLVGYLRVDPALRAHRKKAGYQEAPAFALNDGARIVYMQPVVR